MRLPRILQPSLLAAACLAGLSGAASAQSLLTNGGFEAPGSGYVSLPGLSGYITGWTTVLNGVEYFNAGSWGGAAEGLMAVDLANYVYTGGGIEQTVATVAGQRYDLRFFAGNHIFGGRDGTGIVHLSIDGTLAGDFATAVATSSTIAWAQRDFSFVATGASTTLRFWNEQNPYAHFAYIDGVSVQAAVPEPATLGLMLAGLLAVRAGARRRR